MGGIIKKITSVVTAVVFVVASVPLAYAQQVLNLPAPGTRIELTAPYNPPILKGIKIDPSNPFKMDFLLDPGDGGPVDAAGVSGADKEEYLALIRYFMASLTIPDKDMWVNLSPYEKNRIVPDSFGATLMGRDLLAQDYILKQITSSLMYPEEDTGREFWKKIYAKAYELYGTVNIPVDTFNKVWITPDVAEVFEDKGAALIGDNHLRVMLETDYLAEKNNRLPSQDAEASSSSAVAENPMGGKARDILREVIVPVLEKEINEGRNFVQLRQVYRSYILAMWYKKRFKESILAQVYMDKNKVRGVNIDDAREKEKIFARYVEAFKQGAYNYIREEKDEGTGVVFPRKYFSGGIVLPEHENAMITKPLRALKTLVVGSFLALSSVFVAPSFLKAEPVFDVPLAPSLSVGSVLYNPANLSALDRWTGDAANNAWPMRIPGTAQEQFSGPGVLLTAATMFLPYFELEAEEVLAHYYTAGKSDVWSPLALHIKFGGASYVKIGLKEGSTDWEKVLDDDLAITAAPVNWFSAQTGEIIEAAGRGEVSLRGFIKYHLMNERLLERLSLDSLHGTGAQEYVRLLAIQAGGRDKVPLIKHNMELARTVATVNLVQGSLMQILAAAGVKVPWAQSHLTTGLTVDGPFVGVKSFELNKAGWTIEAAKTLVAGDGKVSYLIRSNWREGPVNDVMLGLERGKWVAGFQVKRNLGYGMWAYAKISTSEVFPNGDGFLLSPKYQLGVSLNLNKLTNKGASDFASTGGIDFNADMLKLSLKGDGSGVMKDMDPALIKQFKDAPGLMPVILGIAPVKDLSLFLGLK